MGNNEEYILYLVERHEGSHDDYRTTPIKVFEDKNEAEAFKNKCNENLIPFLEKMHKHMKKFSKELDEWTKKFDSASEMITEESYEKWSDEIDSEYNEIIKTFELDNLKDFDEPINYTCSPIELVKKG